MQPAVVFSCLLLALCLLFGHVRGNGSSLCMGNQVECGVNASCVNDQCVCPSGTSGNPRVFCESGRCVCTGRADTIYNLFDPLVLKVNVPCSVDLVSSSNIGGCPVNFITAHPEVRHGDAKATDPTFRTFINSLEVQVFVQSAFSLLHATLNGTGITPQTITGVTTTSIPGPSDATTLRVLRVGPCGDLTVGFKQIYGEAFISAPMGGVLNGLCGNCNNAIEEGPFNTAGQKVSYFLANITEASRQRGPFVTQCSIIANATRQATCTTARRDLAGSICGRLLGTFGRCLLNAGSQTKDQIMSLFATCVTSACSGTIATTLCSQLTAVQTPACQAGACV